jgi:acyl-CoA reductase-like NAD-dependent aldehyde dehydrogenase
MLIPVINPATEDVIDHIPRGTAEDAERAVQAARSAFRTWRWIPALEKASMLHAIAARIREKQERLATLMTQEGGKPFCENRDEVEWTAACFDYYAEIGRNARGSSLPPVFEHQVNFTIKEPYGVVVAIIPWNYPLLLMSWKVAPALAAGNTVIIKPSEETPLATLALSGAFTVLPKGVVSIVTGYGEEIGEALIKHPETDLIAENVLDNFAQRKSRKHTSNLEAMIPLSSAAMRIRKLLRAPHAGPRI